MGDSRIAHFKVFAVSKGAFSKKPLWSGFGAERPDRLLFNKKTPGYISITECLFISPTGPCKRKLSNPACAYEKYIFRKIYLKNKNTRLYLYNRVPFIKPHRAV
jgi:hypothetical protein